VAPIARALLEGVHVQSLQAADRLLAFDIIIIMLQVRPHAALPHHHTTYVGFTQM
jgi:hypothetical protein